MPVWVGLLTLKLRPYGRNLAKKWKWKYKILEKQHGVVSRLQFTYDWFYFNSAIHVSFMLHFICIDVVTRICFMGGRKYLVTFSQALSVAPYNSSTSLFTRLTHAPQLMKAHIMHRKWKWTTHLSNRIIHCKVQIQHTEKIRHFFCSLILKCVQNQIYILLDTHTNLLHKVLFLIESSV